MIFTPRPYQRLIQDFIFDKRRCSIFASPGTGKTSASIEAFAQLRLFGQAKRALILAPKRVAVSTWPNEIDKWRESFGHLSIAAAIGTPDQRLAALRSTPDIVTINYENVEWLVDQYGDNWPFDTVFADECFVAGTPVSTPQGQKNIESIDVGDIVSTPIGPKKVTYVYRKTTESLIEVCLVNGTRIVCTPSHPFWTDAGWQKAEKLRQTDFVFEKVQTLRGNLCDYSGPGMGAGQRPVLRPSLREDCASAKRSPCGKAILCEGACCEYAAARPVEQGHPYACRNAGEVEHGVERSRLDTGREAGREWQGHECRRSDGCQPPDARMGVELPDQNQRGQRAESSDMLQAGFRMAGLDALSGDRRGISQSTCDQESRLEKRSGLNRVGVAAVSHIECRSGTPVFDIEVEDAHEYFVSGVLVHNCTRLKGLRVSMQVSKKGKEFIAGQGAKRAKALAHVAHKHVQQWVNLTGSPAPNGLVDTWGQQHFIDAGRGLGSSFTAFSHRWFRAVPGSDPKQQRIEPLPFAAAQIQEILAKTSITIDARDWFDIKAPIETIVFVDLPARARKQYDEMQKQLFTWIEHHPLEAFSAGVKSLKCLQMASGSVKVTEDKWLPVHDEKIEALKSIVEETNGAPLLVAYQFRADLERILKAFPFAQSLEKDSKRKEQLFREGKIRMLVVHPLSAGHGLDLQDNCNILVDYSSGFNLEFDEQVIERIGPTRQFQLGKDVPVYRYRIIARDTIEHTAVLPALRKKTSVQDALKDAMNAHKRK